MRLLFDIGHPAHVHYFKNLIRILERKGHEIAITTRDKEFSLYLLDKYGFDYSCTGKNRPSIVGKAISILRNDFLIYRKAKKFKPDIFVSFFTPFAAHVGRILRKPVIGFNDTENAKISIMLAKPFTNLIVVPTCYSGRLPKEKKIVFDGYFELSYLHPKYFKPDSSVLNLLNVKEDEKYVIVRFVSRKASHDIGHGGLSQEAKRKAVTEFAKYAKVFISSEGRLPDSLEEFRIRIPPEKIHDALYYATLLYGESATMASECAVLGTPAVFLDNEGRGYTYEEEAKYNLVFNFTESPDDQDLSIKKTIELLQMKNIKQEWQKRQQKMLSEKIDVTAFMVWLVENFPRSAELIKGSPDYQFNFK